MIFAMLCFIGMGIIFIFVGLKFHLGSLRKPIIYWTTFSSGVYATAPLGASFLFSGLSLPFPSPHLIGSYLMIFATIFLIVGVILSVTMPQFLTPPWLRYLRTKYGDEYFMHLLTEAKEDYQGWLKLTETQEGLEKWAEEAWQRVLLKYKV